MTASTTISTFTLAAGATVGVFASLGVSVASSSVTVLVPNDGTIVQVQTSAGTGPVFPSSESPYSVASEIYLKNTGANSATIAAKIVPTASSGGGGAVSSVFTRTGDVTAASGDYSSFYDALGAATTAQNTAETFATAAVSTETTRAQTAESSKLAKASNLSDVGSTQTSLNNLAGTQSNGKYLRSDGTNTTLSTIQSSDVPTLNQSTTGTSANITGVAALANGGTNNSVAPTVGQSAVATSATATTWQSGFNNGPWIFDPRAYGALGNGNVVTDGAMTASGATLTCATSTPFTSGDVGKVILVKGAGATNPTTLVTTISAYTSSSSVTLAANATTTISGATVMWATDDTAAFQSAINAAVTYAQAHSGYAKVFIPAASGKFYGIGGALVTGTPTFGNAQLTLPIIAPTANKVTLDIEGSGNGGAVRYWNQTVPLTQGSCLVSFGVFASASAQTTSINANGNPAIIGGPTGKQGYGTTNNTYSNLLYSNMQIGLINLSLITTHSNAGLTYGAFNFFGVSCAYLKNVAYGTAGSVSLGTNGGSAGTNDYAAPGSLATGVSIGGLMPANGNNDNCQVENVQCLGGYTYGLFATEHTNIHGGCILYCWSGLCVVGIHSDGGSSGVGAIHAVHVSMLSIEACSFHLDIYGSATIGPSITGMLDIEGTINIHDSSSGTSLATAVGSIELFGSSSAVNVSFPTPLVIVNQEQFPGAVATPTFTMGTAQVNKFYRRATVYVTLATGTGITSIQVSSLMGGVTAPTMTTVYSQLTGPMAVGFTFRVPPGGWWVINGTTAPTMQWMLD